MEHLRIRVRLGIRVTRSGEIGVVRLKIRHLKLEVVNQEICEQGVAVMGYLERKRMSDSTYELSRAGNTHVHEIDTIDHLGVTGHDLVGWNIPEPLANLVSDARASRSTFVRNNGWVVEESRQEDVPERKHRYVIVGGDIGVQRACL